MSADQNARIAKLERKLAEQQALIKRIGGECVPDSLLAESGFEELNNLLAKAKEEGRKEEIPEGWKAVPIEPTDEMMLAAEVHYSSVEYTGLKSTYRAMVLAAPKPQGETE